MRRSIAHVLGVAALLGATTAMGHPGPKVLETVVATVGDRPILWSEVLRRALPLLMALPPDKRAAAKDGIHTQTFERIIEERLVEEDAERLQITVTPDEVDQGVASLAQREGKSPAELLRDLATRGYAEQDVRDDVRRQIVDAKWMIQRVLPMSTEKKMSLGEARLKRLEQLRSEIDVEVRR